MTSLATQLTLRPTLSGQVLPGKDFFKIGTSGENASFLQTVGMITKNHYMLTMFQEGSMSPTRLIRWLLVCHGCLVGLFFDTLFFSMFFPTDTTCPRLESKKVGDIIVLSTASTHPPTCPPSHHT